jgi:hypothetical protein
MPVPVPVPVPRGWVAPPVMAGPWLWTLPAAAAAVAVAGVIYYNVNSTCYIEQYQGDSLVYVPVRGPCPPVPVP